MPTRVTEDLHFLVRGVGNNITRVVAEGHVRFTQEISAARGIPRAPLGIVRLPDRRLCFLQYAFTPFFLGQRLHIPF